MVFVDLEAHTDQQGECISNTASANHGLLGTPEH